MKLEQKDKKTLMIGGAVAVVILLYALVYDPLSQDLTSKKAKIPKKELELMEMRMLQKQYLDMQQNLQHVRAAAEKRGPLLTEIETITRRANLSSKIVSLKPQTGAQTDGFKESIVEIKLDNVTLYDVVNYVHSLEKATLRIRKLYFKPRFDNPKLLNSTILASSAG